MFLDDKVYQYQERFEVPPIYWPPSPPLAWAPKLPEASSLSKIRYNPPAFLKGTLEYSPFRSAWWIEPERGNVLFGVIDPYETWEEHFASRGWMSPQDQIDAGFPLYLQPTFQEGKYEEVIDFGMVYNNVIVNVDFSTVTLAGQVAITTKIASSLDGVTFTAFVVGASQFIPTLRYVKIRLEFFAAN